MPRCPKCEFEYKAGSSECPNCGIIFEKYVKYKASQEKGKTDLIIQCKVCNKEISKNANSCPHCGEPNKIKINKKEPSSSRNEKQNVKKKSSCIVVVGGGFLAFCFILAIFGAIFGDKKPAPSKQVLSTKSAQSDSKNITPRKQRSSTAKKEAWYEGGTLHSASLTQWRAATYRNKLATAADWAFSRPKISKIVRDSGSIETGRTFAVELLNCVDETSTIQGYDNMNAAEIAAMCMILMKWD